MEPAWLLSRFMFTRICPNLPARGKSCGTHLDAQRYPRETGPGGKILPDAEGFIWLGCTIRWLGYPPLGDYQRGIRGQYIALLE
jgi:hypothetical protein